MKIPLIKPYIDDDVKSKVLEVLDSGYLTEGPVTREFENKFKEYIGCGYANAVTSCTTGLEVALRALNIGKGDEVIVPDYTYPATASVAAIVGAKTVIVDVDKDTMLIDYDALEEAVTEKTKAVIPVSIFGNPLDYDRLNAIKEKHGIYIVEDAACSIGAEFKDEKVGKHADIAVFSLHPRKFITSGEGGVITTNNAEWANWMNSYKHFGMNMDGSGREGIQFDIIGTNYKLSNINSAVGLAQFNKIDELLGRRIELAENYIGLLKDIDGVTVPQVTKTGKHSYQSFCVFIENRDKVMSEMRSRDIEVQIGTYSLHTHKAYNSNEEIILQGDFANSDYVYEHCLTLPLYHQLTGSQQEYVVSNLSEVISNS